MKYLILFSLLYCDFGMSHAQLPRTSWPMINGDPTRSSYARINLEFPLQIADTLFVNYSDENGMALWDHKLYLGDVADSNRLVVTDIISGDSLWSFDVPYTGGSMHFVPAVSDGVVIIGGQSGLGLYGLDAVTGDSLWFLPAGGLYSRSPVISDSLAYLCAGESLICFNLHSGIVKWSKAGFIFQHSPAVDEQKVYSCAFGLPNFLYALDKHTGDTIWINDTIAVGHFLALSVDSQYLYTGFETTISALNKSTGEVSWRVELDTSQFLVQVPGPFARTGDYLVVKYVENGQTYNQYLVLDKNTGQELNRFAGAYIGYGAPTAINDYLADYYHGNFFLYDLLSGIVAFSMSGIPVSGSSSQLIAANDKIFIGGGGPYVIVLESNITGVNDLANDPVTFEISPNPVQDQLDLLVDLDVSSRLYIQFYTEAGALVDSRDLGEYTVGQHRLPLFVGTLGPGLYYLHLQTSQGDVVRKVVIME